MSEDDSSTLVILLETYRTFWESLQAAGGDGRATAAEVIEQVLAFVRAFLLVSEGNRVAIFAVHDASCPLLFASPGLRGGSAAAAQPDAFPAATVKARIAQLAAQPGQTADGPALAGALSRVLCFLHSRQQAAGEAGGAGPGGRRPRVLCLQASADIAAQYIPFMNALFSAQRRDVAVDACMLGASHSSLLQQACHLTGGVYAKPARPAALLQYLLAVYAGGGEARAALVLPRAHGVDFRASCFCHKRAIDLGYVCSVCLSIFCENLQECSTCGTVFLETEVGSKRKGGALAA